MPDTFERLKAALADRYAIEHELGSGGMATVYLAEDLKHERKVAVKVLRPELAAALGADRFLREIKITAGLTHPHILPLLDSGEADGFLYYVMPYVEGESLRERLNREKQLPLDDALQIAREVADALGSAHSHDVVHRDIKPENILLEEGHAVVADFGIARAVTVAGGEKLTETGLAIGTPAYMSPEQGSGEDQVDARSDLYSLGCVVYEMLAGTPPFVGPTARAIIARHMIDAVPPLRTIRPELRTGAARAVSKALAKAPADRFATLSEFTDALAAKDAEQDSATVRSIAVLPFANMSAKPDNEYLCDGMTEEIINALTKIEGLGVASRTSTFAFKGKNQDIRTIGEQLSVGAVLEGSVRQAGKRLRVTAQLVRVADGHHIWSDRYDRDMADVFAVQDEIAGSIVETLRVSVLGETRARPHRRHTESLEAYQLYLKGRHYTRTQGLRGLKPAMECFQKALGHDPGYALAHGNLAVVYVNLGAYHALPARGAFTKARDAAVRALSIDDTLAEAHHALAAVTWLQDWNWQDAKRSYERALELNPSDADALGSYSSYYTSLGRFDEAVTTAERAVQIEPQSHSAQLAFATVYYFARRFADAIERCKIMIDLEPNFSVAYQMAGMSHCCLSNWDQAIAYLERAVQAFAHNTWATAWLGIAYARSGQRERAEKVLSEVLEERLSSELVPLVPIAQLHAILGNVDEAFASLDRAYDTRDWRMLLLKVDPGFDDLRSDPRFDRLLQRMNFPD